MNCSPSTTLAGILADSFIVPPSSLSLQREELKALFLVILSSNQERLIFYPAYPLYDGKYLEC